MRAHCACARGCNVTSFEASFLLRHCAPSPPTSFSFLVAYMSQLHVIPLFCYVKVVKVGCVKFFLHFFSIFSLFELLCVLISIGAHQESLLLAHFCVHGKTDKPKSNPYVLPYLNKIHVSIV